MKARIFFLLAAALGACSDAGRGPARTATLDLDQHNGQKLNGIALDSAKIGSNSNGPVRLLKVSYTDILDADFASVSGSVSLDATALSLGSNDITKNGPYYLSGTTNQGDPILLRIDDVTSAASPNDDLKLYTIQYGLQGGDFAPLCDETETNPPTMAIASAGYWNLDEGDTGNGGFVSSSSYFSFACVDTAVAKCILAGYRPWESYSGTPLANHHEACTRIIRADYCGNGVTHTRNGILIDIYDGLGIQTDTDGSWYFEAVWSTAGAVCVDGTRHDSYLPSCVGTCSSHSFSSTNLLMDRFEYQQ